MKFSVESGLAKEAESGVQWIRKRIEAYDISALEGILIDRKPRQSGCVGGSVTIETGVVSGESKYIVQCHVPGPFPNNTYSNVGGVGLGMGENYEYFADVNDAVVWITSHQCFRWLDETGQIESYHRLRKPAFFASIQLMQYRNHSRRLWR